MDRPNSSKEILTFYPTMEEMKCFRRYYQFMLSKGAHRGGVAKIIPPAGYKARDGSYDDISAMKIPHVTQERLEEHGYGVYQKVCNRKGRSRTVAKFREMCNSAKYAPPAFPSYAHADEKFWETCTGTVYYADSIEGSLFSDSQTVWNLTKLDTDMDLLTEVYRHQYPGVTTPFLYFGMWGSSFAWHTEDYDLPSINYLHFGASKIWYSVPPEHGKQLEKLAKHLFPAEANQCETFLRHKLTHIHPAVLGAMDIRVNRVEQKAGEFIITFPFGYHQGYNGGFNCAEAVNFCHESWVDYGRAASYCDCFTTLVLDVALFLEVFQPSKVETWLAGEEDDEEVDYSRCPPVPSFEGPEPAYWRDEIAKYIARENHKRAERGLHTPLQSYGELGHWIVEKNTPSPTEQDAE